MPSARRNAFSTWSTTRKSQKAAFANFVTGLQRNINPSITEAQAVDMLAQHIITKPIFEALFEGYSFVKHNAVSQAMQNMLDALEGKDPARRVGEAAALL